MRLVFSLWLLAPTRGLAVRSEVQEVQVEVASTAGFQVRQQGKAAASTAAAAIPQFPTTAFPVVGTYVVLLFSFAERTTMGNCEKPVICKGTHYYQEPAYGCDCSDRPQAYNAPRDHRAEGQIVDVTKYSKGSGKQGYAMKVKFRQYFKPLWIDQADWPKFAEIFSGPFWNSWGSHAASRRAHMPGDLLAGMRVFQRQKENDRAHDVDVVEDAHPGWAVLDRKTHLVGVKDRLLWKTLPSGATNTTVLDQDLEVTFTCAEGDGGRDHTHVSTLHNFKHFTSDNNAIHIAYDAGESLVLPKTLFGGGNYACEKLSLVIKQTIWQEGKSDPRTPSGKFILGVGQATNVRLPDYSHSVAFEFTQTCAADLDWKPSDSANNWRESPFCFKGRHGLFIWDVDDSTGHQTAKTTRSIFYLEDPRGKPRV